ncbi:MAG: Gfo/Idh/MocA family protein [Planctomycetota bacterium]|jgi:predicted dehydrogenase
MSKKKSNRRQFLKTAVGAAAAAGFPYVVPSSALGKAGAVAPSNRIVMGAIGVGSMGTGDMRGFLRRKDVQMVAVCDVDRRHYDQAKKQVDEKYNNNECKAYLDFRELIGRGDLDAVTMALPDQWHAIIAVAAARAELDIHAQKPLARTISEGRAICDAVKKYGVVWQTGSQQRSERKFRRACELVRNGRIGELYKVEVGLPDGGGTGIKPLLDIPPELDWDFWLGPAPWRPYMDFGRGSCHWHWRWIMDYSGGQLTDWAGHHIDIAHWGMGTERTGPVEIEGKGVYPEEGLYDVPSAYKFTCKYANGLTMTVGNDSQQPKGRGAVWYGDKGWVHVKRGRLDAHPKSILNSFIEPDETHLYKSDDHKGNFIDCIRTRAETVAPVEVAHRSISVGLLGEIAMLTGRKLKWDPENERFLNDEQANRMLSRPMRSPWHL